MENNKEEENTKKRKWKTTKGTGLNRSNPNKNNPLETRNKYAALDLADEENDEVTQEKSEEQEQDKAKRPTKEPKTSTNCRKSHSPYYNQRQQQMEGDK